MTEILRENIICMLHKLKDVPQRGGHLFFCTVIIGCNKRKEDSL
nr:MAG TPA: hypothetical protein [Caudoviricetes sp.]